jgi:hypothetical protein
MTRPLGVPSSETVPAPAAASPELELSKSRDFNRSVAGWPNSAFVGEEHCETPSAPKVPTAIDQEAFLIDC